MIHKILSILILTFVSAGLYAQQQPIQVSYYYPKDIPKFQKEVSEFDYHIDAENYGKTTMIIHCESRVGTFDFVFKKKILNKETYRDGKDSYTISEHNLYAFVYIHDHGGILEKVKFQDFGNPVYTPEFDYPNCSISDENQDGIPEFYLSYMGHSDGLDAKPYKQIIYTIPNPSAGKPLTKAKATAYYPAGNEEDIYYEERDSNWQLLPKSIQNKSNSILKKFALSNL